MTSRNVLKRIDLRQRNGLVEKDPDAGPVLATAEVSTRIQINRSTLFGLPKRDGSRPHLTSIFREDNSPNRFDVFQGIITMAETNDAVSQTQSLDTGMLQTLFNRGLAFHSRGNLADAERVYRDILRQQPDHFDALHHLGVIAIQTGHMEQAADLIERAIALKPSDAAAHSNLGKALRDLNRPERALASFDRAIALKPDFAEAHHNRGSSLLDLKRSREALASCRKAIALKPEFAEAHDNLGMALENLGYLEQALASCDKAIALKPDFAEAHNNRGNVLLALRRFRDALASYDRALASRPSFAMAHNNRGMALLALERPAQALASFDRSISLNPNLALVHRNRGRALKDLNRLDEAFAAYDKAFTLEKDLIGAEGERLLTKMRICDWASLDSDCANLIASVTNGKPVVAPFAFLTIPASPAVQLQCAKIWVANECPAADPPIWRGERYKHNRIRIAYVSPDFRKHAIAFLTAGMFECHDRTRFEITAMSCGPDDKSEIRARVAKSFDRFIDVTAFSDDRVARMIRELETDIAVDLAGFTGGARMNVFAQRPAPVAVNYLGYPGTSGAGYIDYIIADRVVVPESHRQFYTEKIVYLPNSYQANDVKRPIASKPFDRCQLGLPRAGFVFCCFNTNHKITPAVFDGWMRILKQVEDSVLWLFESSPIATSNLRREAETRGVDAKRLVFARAMPPPDHLVRHSLADLFLDTLPYGAHTTASDALWAGLPVLTCLGESFAGRVSASLLQAIGLPELIKTTSEAYEQAAVELARHPDKLAHLKRKLAENWRTAPLFDTALFTKHIEAAYTGMYERYQAGLAPDHMCVPP